MSLLEHTATRLFGPNYRPEWPRGVRPLAPDLDEWGRVDPELFKQTGPLAFGDALESWKERHPELFRAKAVEEDP